MGKKLDVLLCRHFKTSKFKSLVKLAVSRLSVLRNQHQARCSIARSDVVQFLKFGHHDRALLRVEQVIKEQNMLDAYVMIEGYCYLLVERINLIEQERECHEDLKEAVSGLLFAASRCGEFPELQEMRAIFTSRFGKELAARAIELRNNCGVDPKMVQKLSTRPPCLENKLKVLREIASENNIVLQIEEASSVVTEEKSKIEQKQNQPNTSEIPGGLKFGDDLHDKIENIEDLTRKYKDVADAAEAAFKSAAYAAAAARAAVELSRSHDPYDQTSPGPQQRKQTNKYVERESKLQTLKDENNLRRIEDQNVEVGLEKVHENDLRRIEDHNVGVGFEKVHLQIQNNHSESDDEIHGEKTVEESEESEKETEYKQSMPSLNLDSGKHVSEGTRLPLDVLEKTRPVEGIVFDESDDETMSFDTKKPSLLVNQSLDYGKSHTIQNEDLYEEDRTTRPQSQKKFPLRSENPKANSAERFGVKSSHRLDAENRPISVRTRRVQGR